MEKQLYSPGYHMNWLHSKNKSHEIEPKEKICYSPNLLASSTSEDVSLEANIQISEIEQLACTTDTIIPNNNTESEDDYVSPNSQDREYAKPFDPENISITERDEETLSKLSQYLVSSAFATAIPGLTLLYPLVFIVNIFVIRKIKALAHLSRNEAYHLNQIKRYWRIIIWPVYALIIGLMLFLLFAGLALLA
jgi:hypothetical protein